jgi:hypothetical protein
MSRRKFLRARSLMRPALTPSRVKAYAAGVVGYCTVVVAGLLALVSLSSYAVAQAPLPILRGIVVMPTGEPRAYLEDALTGHLAGYAVRDVVGDSRIEEIRDDRVVLRHGSDVVHVFMGGASATNDPGNSVSASAASPPTADVKPGPVIDNGEAWLEHLGVPPKALSRAIEQAPTKGADNLEDD